MPRKVLLPAAGWLLLAWVGCGPDDPANPLAPKQSVVPPHVKGTVAEYATLVTGAVPLRGYGVVVGLGQNGSSEVPELVRRYLVKHLAQVAKLGSRQAGLDSLTPTRMLNDLDTAAVVVEAVLPLGMPPGTRFDVSVRAFPNTETRSLEGGTLMPTDLHLALGMADVSVGHPRKWAAAAGPVFVHPFIDPSNPADQVKRREGGLLGGGRVGQLQPIRLRVVPPDWGRCRLIERRINQRFGSESKVATAKDNTRIDVTVPPRYRGDYRHFIDLVFHLPLAARQDEWEAHARRLVEAAELPTADHREISLVWEATGRQVLDIIRPLYASKNPRTSYYAARAGLALGDAKIAGEAMLRFAQLANSPFQALAVEDLGRAPDYIPARKALRELLDSDNSEIRIAAYEALRQHGDMAAVTRVEVADGFHMDLVTSNRSYVIYASQADEGRLVLFGRDMAVSRPVFYNPPDDSVTISARAAGEAGSPLLRVADVIDWSTLLTRLCQEAQGDDPAPGKRICQKLPEATAAELLNPRASMAPTNALKMRLIRELNALLCDARLYEATAWRPVLLGQREAGLVQDLDDGKLKDGDVVRLNRRLLELAYPGLIVPAEQALMVYRKIPRTGTYSAPLWIDFRVRTLVQTLGGPAKPGLNRRVDGLGMTYSQVLSILYGMCKTGATKAKFVLEPPRSSRRMFGQAVTIGRPDMPLE